MMKKTITKKQVIKITISLVLIFLIILSVFGLFRIGIFTYSGRTVLGYYEKNKKDFELILEYVKDDKNVDFDLYNTDLTDLDKIHDDKVKSSIMKIFKDGKFDRICTYREIGEGKECKLKSLEFFTPNIFFKSGNPVAIIYSIKELYTESYSDITYNYKRLDHRWYYQYVESLDEIK
jgi:hypothetical protein